MTHVVTDKHEILGRQMNGQSATPPKVAQAYESSREGVYVRRAQRRLWSASRVATRVKEIPPLAF